jgi:serine/threonine protein kinase
VVWRDVKPENFLFANEGDDSPLKAVDFGTAERCKLGEFITARAGSVQLRYRSYELVQAVKRTSIFDLVLHRVSVVCGARGPSAEV